MSTTPGSFDPAPPPIVMGRGVPIEPPPIVGAPAGDGPRVSEPAAPGPWQIPRQMRPSLWNRVKARFREAASALGNSANSHHPAKPQGAVATVVSAAPPWLVSTIVHASLMILLGLIAVEVQREVAEEMSVALAPIEEFSDDEIFAETLGQQLEVPTDIPSDQVVDGFDPTYSNSSLPEVDDPLAAPPPALDITGDGTGLFSDINAPSIGMALSGRQEGRKEALLASYGGTATTQQAVELALAWLARQQARDGSWSLRGPYPGGGSSENKPAATAMALLAFLGDGHTHVDSGPFRSIVQRGMRAMLKFQREDGAFTDEGIQASHQLYTHAQCTIALCELYGLTESSELREPARKAVEFCAKIQSAQGGWRYFPFQDADTSVTGWFVMALQSARMAKMDVSPEALKRVSKFLDSVESHSGARYAYQPGRVETEAMTAEALLCRQYLGWRHDEKRLQSGVKYLGRHPVDFEERNVYYWYYATQVMHHMGGESWVQWNKVMRQEVPSHQVREGRQRGSWDPEDDAWGNQAGRLYVTCLSTYMLEVYYRHLPLYKANIADAHSSALSTDTLSQDETN